MFQTTFSEDCQLNTISQVGDSPLCTDPCICCSVAGDAMMVTGKRHLHGTSNAQAFTQTLQLIIKLGVCWSSTKYDYVTYRSQKKRCHGIPGNANSLPPPNFSPATLLLAVSVCFLQTQTIDFSYKSASTIHWGRVTSFNLSQILTE